MSKETTDALQSTPKRRRGSVSRAILDAVRDGRGRVKEIKPYLEARGLKISNNSISNALSRMHRKHVYFDTKGDRWVLYDGQDAKGPDVVASRPLHMNGAAELSA